MNDLENLGYWTLVILISVVGVLAKLVYFKIGQGGRYGLVLTLADQGIKLVTGDS